MVEMQRDHTSLSVFFPCYNEEQNIKTMVYSTIHTLQQIVNDYEILIINDGSTDNTGSIADSLSQVHPCIRALHHTKNKGYGSTLITGFTNAIKEWVFFTDGDNQFDIFEIKKLLVHRDHYNAIIGYRAKRQDPLHRIIFSKMWNALIRCLFDLNIKDVNCAFKLIRRNLLEKLTLSSSGAVINTELLIKIKQQGEKIKEVAVSHKPREYGHPTGGNPKVILRAFSELIMLYRSMK